MLTPQKHHHTTKSDFSSWAGCCWQPKSTRIIMQTRLQFLGRMLRNTEKYENYHESSTSVLGPDVAAPKTPKKHEFYCKNPVQEHCRTPKSTRITTKNERRRSWRAEKVQKFTDETRFRPFQERRRTPQSTRITTKNEHRRSWRAGNYENLQTKPAGVGAPLRKLRKFTDETNMKARKHENSDEFRAPAVRHLDLATPAFYHYRKNPNGYHTVWGKKHLRKLSREHRSNPKPQLPSLRIHAKMLLK